jgi:hypothetical protein
MKQIKSKNIYKIMVSIAILALISSIGIAINQDQNQDQNGSNLTKEENPTSDIAVPEIDEAKLPTPAEEKTRFENIIKNVPRNLENRSIQKSATQRSTTPPSISTFPSDVSYSNPITGTSTFGTYFSRFDIPNSDFINWKTYSFYLPVASYVYTDVSGELDYVSNAAYYILYIDSNYLNDVYETGSCNSGTYCFLPIQRSRLTYLAKGWHTLGLSGYAYPFGEFYDVYGYISIIAEPEYTAIKVTSPNGGESWAKGTTKTIKWTKNGQPGANVKIELYKAGVLKSVISSMTPNDGAHSWNIPTSQPIGTDYKIKITSTSDSKYYDWSDNNFKIY